MTTQDKIKFDKEALHQRYRVRDTDHDNVPDAFDCKPYDPTQDGLFGDVFSAARRVWSRAPMHFSATRAASRRAAVRRAATHQYNRSVRSGVRVVRHIIRRAPIHVSHARAVRRRASIRRDITRTVRPVAVAIHSIVERTGVDYERAKQRRGTIITAGWHAPTRALTEISNMGAPFRKKMEQRIATTTARQQAKFPAHTLSALSTGIAEGTARVARVARGFEKPIEQRMQVAETTLGLHSERIPAPLRWAGGQAKQFGYGVALSGPASAVEMAGMVPAAVETMAKRPEIIPAAVGVGIYTMGKGMFHGATTHPSRMAGEFVAFGALGKAPSLSPVKFKPTVVRFPSAKGISFGMETRRGSVTEFRPGITVMPRAEKFVTVGTPRVLESALVEKGVFTPRTALEAKITARSLGTEGAKITEARAVRSLTSRANVTIKEITPTIKEVLKHHDISEKSARVVLNTTKSHAGTVYGSIIQRAAGERGLLRVPRDFDVVVKDPIKFAEDVATKINKAEGRQVVVANEGKVTVRSTGAKLFDIHAPETTPSSYAGRTELGYGLLPEPLIKPEGLQMRSFSEQMSRKLEGGMIVGQKRTLESPLGSVTGRIVPKHEGRIKDILDFYTGEKLAIDRLSARGKIKSAAKANAHLEKWLDTWGDEFASNIRTISKKQIQAGIPTKVALEMSEPSPTTRAAYPLYSEATSAYPSMPPSTPSTSVPPYGAPAYEIAPPPSTYRLPSPPPRRGYVPPPQQYKLPSPPRRGYAPPPSTPTYKVPPPPPTPTYKVPPPPPTPTYKVPPPPSTPTYKVPPPPSTPTYKVPPPPSTPTYKVPPPPSTPTYKVPPPPPTTTIRIPKTKGKKELARKRRKYKPKYWQIENPIANIQEMLFGRSVGQTRVQPSFSLPTQMPPKQSKKTKKGKIEDPHVKIRKVMFGRLKDRQLNK